MQFAKNAMTVFTSLNPLVLVSVAGLVLGGCASTTDSLMGSGTHVTATDKARMTHSGFLSDYARLKPVQGTGGVECWKEPGLQASAYNKLLIGRMAVTLKPGEQKSVDPSDLKALTDYFHDSLASALKSQLKVVDKAGPGVLVLRIALTDLVPTKVEDSLTGTLIPYGVVAEAGSGGASGRPAGSTPYLG